MVKKTFFSFMIPMFSAININFSIFISKTVFTEEGVNQ
jgi:hypothetical protein